MSAGFRVFREDGKLQFDAGLPTFSLVSKGKQATRSRFGANTSPSTLLIAAPATHLVALRASFLTARAGHNGENQVFQTEAPVGSVVDYWVFASTPTIQTVNPAAGLVLYDDLGRMTYSSDLKTMRVGGLISHGSEGDQGIATLPAGRLYATVYPSFAGHGYEGDGTYADGVPVIDPGGGDPNTQWSRDVNGKLYGTRWNGSTCESGEVSFDDVRGQTNRGPEPDPPRHFWANPMVNALLVDVTHL